MSNDNQITEAIRRLSGTHMQDRVYLLPCTVNSYNEASRTCDATALNGPADYDMSNIRLMAALDDGILYLPSIGSTIFAIFSDYNPQPLAVLFSQVDKILYIVNNTTLEIIDGTIQLNDGSFGGLVEVIKLTQKLNNLENLVNDLIVKYNSHTHPGVQVGAGVSSPTVMQETGTLTPTVRADIENTKVTHGQ